MSKPHLEYCPNWSIRPQGLRSVCKMGRESVSVVPHLMARRRFLQRAALTFTRFPPSSEETQPRSVDAHRNLKDMKHWGFQSPRSAGLNPASSPLESTVRLFLFLCIISASAFHLSVCLLPTLCFLSVPSFACAKPPPPVFRGPHQNPRVPAAPQSFTVDISLPPPCCSSSFARQAVAVSALEGARRSAPRFLFFRRLL